MDRVIGFFLIGLGLGHPTQCSAADVVAYLKSSPVQIYGDADLTKKVRSVSFEFGQGVKISMQTENSIELILSDEKTGWIKKSDAIISAMIGTVVDGQGYHLQDRPKVMLWNDPGRLGEFLSSNNPKQFPPDWFEVPSIEKNANLILPLIASDHKLTKEGRSIELAEVLIPFTPQTLQSLELGRHGTGQNYNIAFLVDRSPDAVDFSEKLLTDISNRLERLLADGKNNFSISLSYFGAGDAFQFHADRGLDGMRKKLIRKPKIDMDQGEPLEYALQSELAAADPTVSGTIVVVLSGANLDSEHMPESEIDKSITKNINENKSPSLSAIIAQSTPEPGPDLSELVKASGHKIQSQFLDYSEDLSKQITDMIADKIKPSNSEALDLFTLQAICKLRNPLLFPCFLPADSQPNLINQFSNSEWIAYPTWVVIDGLIMTSTFLPTPNQNKALEMPDADPDLLSGALKKNSELRMKLSATREEARLTALELLTTKQEMQDITAQSALIEDSLTYSTQSIQLLEVKRKNLSKKIYELEDEIVLAKEKYASQEDRLRETDRGLRNQKIMADQNLNRVMKQSRNELAKSILELSTAKAEFSAQIESLRLKYIANLEQLKNARDKLDALSETVTKITSDRDGLLISLSSAETKLLLEKAALHAASIKQEATSQQVKEFERKLAAVSERSAAITSELMRSRNISESVAADNLKLKTILNSSYGELAHIKSKLLLSDDNLNLMTIKANKYAVDLDASIKGMEAYREAAVSENLKNVAKIDNLELNLSVSKKLLHDNLAKNSAEFSRNLIASELEKEELSKKVSNLHSKNVDLLSDSVLEKSKFEQERTEIIIELKDAKAKIKKSAEDLATQNDLTAKFSGDLKRASKKIETLSQDLKASDQEVEDLKLDLVKASSKAKLSAVAPSQKPISNTPPPKTTLPSESGSATGFFGGGG